MKIFFESDLPEIVDWLMAGKIGVLRTDTLYGLVCRADNQAAVERVYASKSRDGDKSPIVLVATQQQLFDRPSEETRRFLETVWPGKVSVVLPSSTAPYWIERGNSSVAYRLPDATWLQTLLAQTGPLIAPSANPQGKPPAETIERAAAYFGDDIDFYVEGGEVTDGTASQMLRIKVNGTIERLR
ncbi:L-threonylcarbamoyladenylate synthase [Candidatus Saccharibacteria bacterium]|nr:L-threonylcarbamoyladenylate synthase [Candidatus Saccharibacteria bacterium]